MKIPEPGSLAYYNKQLDELLLDLHEWVDYKFAVLDGVLNERFKNWEMGFKISDFMEELKLPLNLAVERIAIFGTAAFHISEKGYIKGIDPYQLGEKSSMGIIFYDEKGDYVKHE